MSFTSYAQNFEDVMLWRALKHVKKGVYVDVGAQHPIIDSVSKAFYEKGWRGIHFEPVPYYAALLRQDRPDEVVLEVAISDIDGTSDFYRIDNTGLSTAVKEYADKHYNKNRFEYKKVQVPTLTLKTALNSVKSKDVHWLKIDVEGFEEKVLKGWDSQTLRPWVMVIEATAPLSTIESYKSWEHIILDSDYQFVYFDGLNRFYVAKEHSELIGAFSCPPNVFDEIELSGLANSSLCNKLVAKELLQETELREQQAVQLLQETELREQQAVQLLQETELREQQAVQLLQETELREQQAVQLLQELLVSKELKLDQLNQQVIRIEASKSWRVTKFLRWLNLQKKLLEELGFFSRFKAYINKNHPYLVKVYTLTFIVPLVSFLPKKNEPLINTVSRLSMRTYITTQGLYGNQLKAALINLQSTKNIAVSVIIINYNSDDFIFKCISHVAESNFNHGLEIIVINNSPSSNAMIGLHNLEPSIRVIDNHTNRYFGEANNIAAETAKGDFICFLNADAFVTKDCFYELYRYLVNDSATVATGPMFLNIDGTIQEAGALMQSDGIPIRLGRGCEPDDPNFNNILNVDYISAACLMVRREPFFHVGGFDHKFEPAYYEDVDLCEQLRLNFGKITYLPQAKSFHIEGGTIQNDEQRIFIHNLGELNRIKFCTSRKYARNIEFFTKFSVKKIFTSCDRKNHAVVYTPYNLTLGGGERYIFSLLHVLGTEFNYFPVILTDCPYSKLRVLQLCTELNLLFDLEVTTIAEYEKEYTPSLFFALGNHAVPPLMGIGKRNFFICQFPFPMENETYEPKHDWNYEGVIVYSQFVKDNLQKSPIALKTQISVLTPYIRLVDNNYVQKLSDRNDIKKKNIEIITVGRFFAGGHNKQHGLLIEWFKELFSTNSNLILHIVGTTMPDIVHMNYLQELKKQASGYPIHFHVNLSDIELYGLYESSFLYWHATGYGVNEVINPEKLEHFGISVLEAMSHNCIPVVYGKGGPPLVLGKDLYELTYLSKEEFLKLNINHIDNAYKCSLLQSKIQKRAQHFSVNNFKNKLAELIT